MTTKSGTDNAERLARVKATRGRGRSAEQGQTATIYTRISQDKRGLGAGSERQLAECREYCEREGWEIVGEFDDPSTSASKGKVRPALEAMLASNPERIIVWDVDRLLRSPKELERLIDLNLDVYAATNSKSRMDLTSVNGRAMARIVVAMAAQEGEHKAERIQLEAEQRASEGRPKWGRRPFGFNSDTTIREEEAQRVRQAYADLLAGQTVSAIARGWNEQGQTTTGGKAWTPAMVSEFLRSPRNAGILVFRGEEVGQGTWDGIVSEATFRAAQRVFARPERKTGGGGKRKYLLSGIATCEKCGGPVAGGTKGEGTEPAYRCTKSDHFRVPVDFIDGLMFRWLPLILEDPKARAHWRHTLDVAGEDGGALTEERDALTERAQALSEDYAAMRIDRAQLLAGTDTIRSRVAQIDAELGEVVAAASTVKWWNDTEYVWQELDAMPTDELRELIRRVCLTVAIRQRGRGPKNAKLRAELLQVEAIGGSTYPKTED